MAEQGLKNLEDQQQTIASGETPPGLSPAPAPVIKTVDPIFESATPLDLKPSNEPRSGVKITGPAGLGSQVDTDTLPGGLDIGVGSQATGSPVTQGLVQQDLEDKATKTSKFGQTEAPAGLGAGLLKSMTDGTSDTTNLKEVTKAPVKEEKKTTVKDAAPVVDEAAFNTQKDIDEARAQASSIINLDAAKDDVERQKLEELQQLENDISIERMQSERLLTKRLKESGNFGQGLGNSLQRSLMRDLSATFTDARTTVAKTFNKQISDLVSKEMDLRNAEVSNLLSEKRVQDFDNKMASLDASMGLFNSLTDPESQIALAAQYAEQYPEIGYFNDLATKPELQEALREAAEPARQQAVEINRDKALNLATQFELDIKGTPGAALQEEEMKGRFADLLKQDNEFLFNADVEGFQQSILDDQTLLNKMYGVDGANEIKDAINKGTFEDAEQAYIDFKWDVSRKASSDSNLKSVLNDSFVDSLQTEAQREIANDYVDTLTKRTGSEVFSGKIKLDGDTFLGFELADGQVVSDPSQIPGFDVIFEDWDGNAYNESQGHVRSDDPEYFEWLTDKYTDYLSGLKEGETASSRDNFRSNMEKYLTDSGVDVSEAANNPAGINISTLPDLRGSNLQNAGQTGIVVPSDNNIPTTPIVPNKLSSEDIQKTEGEGVDIFKVDELGDELSVGNISLNEIDDPNTLRKILASASDPIGIIDGIAANAGPVENGGNGTFLISNTTKSTTRPDRGSFLSYTPEEFILQGLSGKPVVMAGDEFTGSDENQIFKSDMNLSVKVNSITGNLEISPELGLLNLDGSDGGFGPFVSQDFANNLDKISISKDELDTFTIGGLTLRELLNSDKLRVSFSSNKEEGRVNDFLGNSQAPSGITV